MRKTWLGWKIAAHSIDFANRAADAAAIFQYHRQIAGAQKLLAGRLAVGPQVDAEGHHAPVAKVDHQPGLVRRAIQGAQRTIHSSWAGVAEHRAGRTRMRRRGRQQRHQQSEDDQGME